MADPPYPQGVFTILALREEEPVASAQWAAE